MSETYTAANIQILDAGQIAHRWFWAEAGLLATQYRRPEEWIRRGLLACEVAGVSHDYFVDRYLRKQPVPLHSGVDSAMRALMDRANGPGRHLECATSDFADKTTSTPHLESSAAIEALPCCSSGIAAVSPDRRLT